MCSPPFRSHMPLNLHTGSAGRGVGQRTVRRDGVQIPQNLIRNLCTDSLSAKQPARLLGGELALGGAQESQGCVAVSASNAPQMLRRKGVCGHNPRACAPGPTPVDRPPPPPGGHQTASPRSNTGISAEPRPGRAVRIPQKQGR